MSDLGTFFMVIGALTTIAMFLVAIDTIITWALKE